MATTKKKSVKKEMHESFTEKIGHMLSDVTHSVQEIPFKKMIKKAAKVITDVIHPGTKAARKKTKKPSAVPVKKTAVKKVAAKKIVRKPVA